MGKFAVPDLNSFNDADRQRAEYVIERDRRRFYSLNDSSQPYEIAPLLHAWLQSPKVGFFWARLGDFFMTGEARGSYSNHEREMVDQVLAHELDTQIAFGHMSDAVGVGISPADISAILAGSYQDLSSEDRLMAEYIAAVANGSVDELQFGDLAARRGQTTAIEYTLLICYKIALMRSLQALYAAQGITEQMKESADLLAALNEGRGRVSPHDRGNSWVQEPD